MMRRAFLKSSLAVGAAIGASAHATQAEARDGFYVPAEEVLHDRTFMQWPVDRRVYSDRVFLETVQDTIAEVASTIAEFEPVVLLADRKHHAIIKRRVSSQVTLWDVPTEDLWCRDSGPIFVIDGAGNLAIRHIQFNGWGARQTHQNDGKVAELVADFLNLPLLPTPLVGEAGGIEQDGHGTLIAHESSWVHDNRNPGQTRDQIGDALLNAYGADRLVWAPGLKDLDVTDYHIDSLARFTGPGRILMNLPETPDRNDPFHQAALHTHDILDSSGFAIEVIPEPNRRRVRSDEFVASYVNYYVCNGAVIAAQFGDPETDAIARGALSRHYPGREIVMLNADALGEIGGGIHCATQQMPAV